VIKAEQVAEVNLKRGGNTEISFILFAIMEKVCERRAEMCSWETEEKTFDKGREIHKRYHKWNPSVEFNMKVSVISALSEQMTYLIHLYL
jgi:hypothetical protein